MVWSASLMAQTGSKCNLKAADLCMPLLWHIADLIINYHWWKNSSVWFFFSLEIWDDAMEHFLVPGYTGPPTQQRVDAPVFLPRPHKHALNIMFSKYGNLIEMSFSYDHGFPPQKKHSFHFLHHEHMKSNPEIKAQRSFHKQNGPVGNSGAKITQHRGATVKWIGIEPALCKFVWIF